MSTRLRDITRESDLARVPTRDLDPDPSNGLKNENQQRGERRNQGSVRQQPITVPMNGQQQPSGFDMRMVGGLEQFMQNQEDEQGFIKQNFNRFVADPVRNFLNPQIALEGPTPSLASPRFQFGAELPRPDVAGLEQPEIPNAGQQFSGPFDTVGGGLDVLSDPLASEPRQFQDVNRFVVNQTQQQQRRNILRQNPDVRRVVSDGPPVEPFQQTLPGTDIPISERQNIALGLSGIVGVPGLGRAGQIVNTRLNRLGPRLRGLGVRGERLGQQLGQATGRALPGGSRGQLQLTEPIQRLRGAGQGGAQRFMEAARVAQRRPVTPGEQSLVQQIRGAPSGLAQRTGGMTEVQRALQAVQDPRTAFRGFQPGAREVTGGGTPPIDPNLLQVARQQDLAMAARALSQQRQTASLGQQVTGRPGALEFLEGAGQVSFRDFPSPPGTLETPLGMGEFQVSIPGQQSTQMTGTGQRGGQPPFSFGEIRPTGGFFDQPPTTTPNLFREDITPGFTRPGTQLNQFTGIRQPPTGSRVTQDFRTTPNQVFREFDRVTQRQPDPTNRTLDPINPRIFNDPRNDVPPRTPPRFTPRFPGRPPRIPGVPPVFGFGGGGGGAGGAGTRRRFPFGRIRQFSPAFPGTSFRVLPDGTVVLDVDPGTGQQQTGRAAQRRDPDTGQFVPQA